MGALNKCHLSPCFCPDPALAFVVICEVDKQLKEHILFLSLYLCIQGNMYTHRHTHTHHPAFQRNILKKKTFHWIPQCFYMHNLIFVKNFNQQKIILCSSSIIAPVVQINHLYYYENYYYCYYCNYHHFTTNESKITLASLLMHMSGWGVCENNYTFFCFCKWQHMIPYFLIEA